MWMLAIAALASLMLAGVAEAIDRFVSKTGSDTGNDCGTAGAPCQTIARALAVAASGDVIKVARGTYGENLLIDANGTRLFQGGWDRSFGARDVAANPTILRRRPGERVLRIS